MNKGKYRFVAAFLAAPVLLYAVFVVSPYVQAAYISLTSWSGLTSAKPFIGLGNYVRLVQDGDFWVALAHNAILLLVVPIVTIVLGLFFASMLNVGSGAGRGVRGVRGAGLYKVVFFLPYIMPAVIAAVLWEFIYNPQIGMLDGALDALGLGGLKRDWLGDPSVALWSLMGVMVWAGVGFYVVLFSAAMQSIPKDIYEAAELDGASRWAVMRRITVPMLRSTVQVAYIYLGIAALDAFTLVQVITPKGGPDNSTSVVALYLYDTAFQQGEFGYASAIGVAMCVLTLVLAAITFRSGRRERLEF
jgi:N-acetylglucosamine transport system permease protein